MSEILKKYRVLKAVIISGRVEAGAIVELSEADAKNIGVGEYLEEVAPPAEQAKPADAEKGSDENSGQGGADA